MGEDGGWRMAFLQTAIFQLLSSIFQF